MFRLKLAYLGAAVGCLVLPLTALDVANAGPIAVVRGSVLSPSDSDQSPSDLITDIRYRRPIRHRRGVGPAAVLGLFGAVLGGIAASQRYDNYSYDSYGQPYDYGYSPGYVSGPIYRGGAGRAGFGGRGGGARGGGARGGGAHGAGGGVHAGKH